MEQIELDLSSSNRSSSNISPVVSEPGVTLDFNQYRQKVNAAQRRDFMLSAIKLNEGLLRDLIKSRI